MKNVIKTAIFATTLVAVAAPSFANGGNTTMRYRSADGAECSVVKPSSKFASIESKYENPLGGYGTAAGQTKLTLGASINWVLSADKDQGDFTCENLMKQDNEVRELDKQQKELEIESLELQLEQLKQQMAAQEAAAKANAAAAAAAPSDW